MPGIPDTRYYSHWRSDAPHDIIVSIGQLGKCNNNYANKIGQGNAGDLARELFAIKLENLVVSAKYKPRSVLCFSGTRKHPTFGPAIRGVTPVTRRRGHRQLGLDNTPGGSRKSL